MIELTQAEARFLVLTAKNGIAGLEEVSRNDLLDSPRGT